MLGWSQQVWSSCHRPFISPCAFCQRCPFSSLQKEAGIPWICVLKICVPLPGLVRVFFVESWEIISSLLFPAFLAPRNQCPHEAPGETEAQGGPRWLTSEFQRSCLLWHLSIVLCFVLSRVRPPTTFKWFFFFFSWFTFLCFVFSFSAACHRNDTHSAESALDSFLQTRTTNSPVREQSERKMKNNIRKEPFGKLHKKCYIKIDTGAWPFVVLYILKPSIDSLLITCLF